MSYTARRGGERAGAAALSAVVVAGLGYALIAGLTVTSPARLADAALSMFTVMPPAPPPPPERPPPHPRAAAREGASAPPNLKSRATEVAAPKPLVPPIQPPPIVTAPIPAIGLDASSGAALVAGPGTGAGGQGNGMGSGRSGNGSGGGGTPARLVSDTLRIHDLPAALVREVLSDGQHYSIYLRFTVGVNGRVTDCATTRSSGVAALDAATCDAAMRRLRYRPELDRDGRPIAVTFVGVQEWSAINGLSPSGRDEEQD